VSGSGISWAMCKSASRSREYHASTPPLKFFTGRMPYLLPNQQRQSTEVYPERYQKGKTNLDFTESRDSEWQWHQLGHVQVCISLQRVPCQYPTTQVFYRPDALPAAQPTASKH